MNGVPGSRRAQGWYRDPEDPIRMRHWSGRSWSGRRRPLPAWSVAQRDFVLDESWGSQDGVDNPVLDGPVRAEALPAIAAAGAPGTESITRRRHPTTAGPQGLRTGRRSDVPGLTQSHYLPQHHLARTRLSFLFCSCLAVVALLVAAVHGGSGTSASYSPVAEDRTFLAAAYKACTTSLGQRQTVPSITAKATAASDAAQITTATATLESLVRTLERAPSTPGAEPQIARWLGDWKSYIAEERAYATALVSPQAEAGPGPDATLARASAESAAAGADDFAAANGLGACTLDGPVNTSIGTIP